MSLRLLFSFISYHAYFQLYYSASWWFCGLFEERWTSYFAARCRRGCTLWQKLRWRQFVELELCWRFLSKRSKLLSV